ncbi:hypothetical protein ACFL6Y_08250 [Elusimicrobiota bacterium]
MKSPGNFLILDEETTKLLQILSKIHPHGNKRVLRILLKFYIKLAKHARSKNMEPLTLIEDISQKYLSKEYSGFELGRIKKIDDAIESVEGAAVSSDARDASGDMSELKALIREVRSTMAARSGAPDTEDTFSPKEAAKLVKVKGSGAQKKRQDYRQIRKQQRPRKIDL